MTSFRNILTGIIDDPNNLRLISSTFVRILLTLFEKEIHGDVNFIPKRYLEFLLDDTQLESVQVRFLSCILYTFMLFMFL